MIVISCSPQYGEQRYGPLGQEAAERLVIQLAASGAYVSVELVASDDINIEASAVVAPA